MIQVVVLDAGVLGLLTHPNPSPESIACNRWLADLAAAGDIVAVPEIADYELRREYVRRGATRALQNLNALGRQARYVPLTTAAMRKAAIMGISMLRAPISTRM